MIDYKNSKVQEESTLEMIVLGSCFIAVILMSIAIMFLEAV